MAQQPPIQPPVAQAQEEQVIIVRGSEEHKDYLKHQFGHIKDTVNSFETRIAVAGRALLLVYVVYITVKAAVSSSLPHDMAPWLTAALLLLDIVMQALQVLGLEGSVPGLTHLAGELEDKGKTKEARTVRLASNTAQWLLAFTAIDIVLESNHNWGGMDISGFAAGYTNCLFIVRVIVIGLYLVAMARMEHQGPKVVSAREAARMEQEQVRMDNATIQDSIQKALSAWTQSRTQQQEAHNDETLNRWMAKQSQQLAEEFASLKQSSQAPAVNVDNLTASVFASLRGHFDHQIEAVKQQSEAETRRQIEASKRDIEAKLSAQREAPHRSNEAPRRNADAPTDPRHEAARPPAAPGLLRLPVNMDRAAQKAEALRLVDSGISTYKAAEQTGIPSGTIQRWLSERAKAEAERKAKEA
jgi:hypothetical protein